MDKIDRLKQIWSYARKGASPVSMFRLGIAGYARGNYLLGKSFVQRTLHRHVPVIRFRSRSFHNYLIEMDVTDHGHLISFEELIRDNSYNFTLVPFVPKTVLDCGGHIGFFTLHAAASYPDADITVFEPNPVNFRWLERQLDRNKVKAKREAAAVWIADGTSFFTCTLSNSGSLTDTPVEDSYSVRTIDLRSRIPQEGPLLLKIDIEGPEETLIPALAGILPRQTALFFETHRGEEAWKIVESSLISAGFKVIQLTSRCGWCDGFALRT